MKKILSIALSLILILGLSSCENWLDVNTNPDNPNNESATVEIRLPWIQYFYMYAWGSASVRTSAGAQMITNTSRTNNITRNALWNPSQSMATTPYQNWFVGAANNIPDLITKAQKTGAIHYEAAALVVKSMGYIMLADLYGEIPYTYACTEDFSPAFDRGDVVYAGCLADLDRAIELFSQSQPAGTTPLSAGDTWNGGDTNKWIKLCYGLKARWLNNLSKTSQYDPEAILAALNKAPQSNGDNIKMTHYNVENAGTSFLSGDAYGPNVVWDTAAWGTGQRLCRWYVNLLTNFKGTGVEDPRADKLLPSSMINVKLSDDGTRIVSYEWLRDCGVDMSGIDEGWIDNRYEGGNLNSYLTPVTTDATQSYNKEDIVKYYVSVDAFINNFRKYYNEENATIVDNGTTIDITYHPGAMYVKETKPNPLYTEDVKYVQLRSDGLFETYGLSNTDMCCYYSGVSATTRSLGWVQGTGAFYTRPDSDSDILTYAEMLFIKAEVLFRKGDKAGAYTAYTDAIKAHFARMNDKLEYWTGMGCGTTARGIDVSFAYSPIPQTEIDAYMASAAVAQSSADLTLSDIMMQKIIAVGFSTVNWNDMRRYNYNSGNIGGFGVIYTELDEPSYRTSDYCTFSTDPSSDMYHFRRWMYPSLETGYNSTETDKSVEQYASYGIESALDYKIYSIPVWWDWTK